MHTTVGTTCGYGHRMTAPWISLRLCCVWLCGVLAGASACDGEVDDDGTGSRPAAARTTFGWRAVQSALTPVWGGFVAEGGARPLRVGGVAGTGGPVIDSAEGPAERGDTIASDDLVLLDGPRYCGCGFVDQGRNELVVIGGRDGRFRDVETAVVISLDDGTVTPIDDVGPAAFPVGCVAFFLPSLQTGYVFSGLSSNQRAFGTGLFRWDGEARRFSLVDGVTGPAPRYDAAVHVESQGTSALVASGMGLGLGGGSVFFRDVWRFDGETVSWSEVPTTQPPPGRRFAWSALGPDDDTFVFGFGSDSPTGESLLGDLWRLSLRSGIWQRLDDDASVFDQETLLPPRAFASRLPGLTGTAGLLSGGMQAGELAQDAYVLDVPTELVGEWR
jgi:hypothetical protein